MGIKHFFMWYKNNMKSTMHSFAKHTTLKDKNISIDNLLLDLNGNIHTLPFQQLLSVLPPKSSHLLPNPLNKCLIDKQSKMARFCPDKITIDLAGKRREWEGIMGLTETNYL